MPELRNVTEASERSITVDGDVVAEMSGGELDISRTYDEYICLTPSEARAYCEIIAGWFGGAVTWSKEASDA